MRLLLIRPEAESRAFADRLAPRGIECLVAPLLKIVPAAEAPDLAGVHALLVTSVNGARAFAGLSPRRDLPVFAVGAATAAAAREAGFASVVSADGDGAALADRVAAALPPGAGSLLHLSGADVAGDLSGALAARGHQVRRAVVYRADLAAELPAAARAALAEGRIDGVPFFSPRSADAFVRLARAAGVDGAAARARAYCLSEAVARPARALGWRAVRVAPAPNADALVGLIVEDAAREEPPMTERPTATPAPPPPPPASPRAPSVPLVASLVALAVSVVVLGAGLLLFGPGPAPVADLGAVRARLDALERRPAPSDPAPLQARIDALERRPAAADPAPIAARLEALERRPTADTAPLSEAIRRLQAEVTRLAERPAGDPALAVDLRRLEGAVDALAKRLGTAETAIRDAELRERIGERALIALGALRAAAASGRPFAADLDAARAALSEDPAARAALDALAPHAAKGAPDAATLARRFDAEAAPIVRQARRGEGGDLVERTMERLSSVVSVRRVDAPPAGTVDAAVAAAERALAAGDVAGALAALAPVRESVAAAAPAWLVAAEARRDVDAAVEMLTRRVAAIVGGR